MTEQFWNTLGRITKVVISAIFFLCAATAALLHKLVGGAPNGTCVVLHYHEISPRTRKRFGRQMDILSARATPIAADYCQPLRTGQRYAVVTFDDGFQSTIENAIPELIKREIPATLFVVADLMGATPQWKTFGTDCVTGEKVAIAEQFRALPRDLITIGSHTLSHPWLPSVSDELASKELHQSRENLKNLLKRDITLFSFPYGAHNERLIQLCRMTGYTRVFTITPSLAFRTPHEFVTGRIKTEPTDWDVEFRLKLVGAYRWLPWALAWKQKLMATMGRSLTEDAKVEVA